MGLTVEGGGDRANRLLSKLPEFTRNSASLFFQSRQADVQQTSPLVLDTSAWFLTPFVTSSCD